MLTYSLKKTADKPLYIALYEKIKTDIAMGVLAPGTRLPSKRSLAKHLTLAVITVENAYAQLLAEGYIFSKERSGYFVSDIVFPKAAPVPAPSPAAPEKTEKEQNTRTKMLDLKSNAIPESRFPFSVWTKLTRGILSEGNGVLSRMPYNGTPALRRAIAEHLRTFRGLLVSPDQIVIGAGTETLYQYLVQFLGRSLTYGVENPGYHDIVHMYKSLGVRCAYADIDKCGVTTAELEKKRISVIHISPSHHFPTGLVMPISRRAELLAWAEQGKHYIIEDEFDSEFRFVGKPIPTLMSADRGEHVIYVNTFSKTISPAIRISYMVLPPKMAAHYKSEMGFYSCTVSALEQLTLAEFIDKGYFEKHINRMKTYYKSRRDELISALQNSRFGAIAKIEEANSGLHFLIRLTTEKSDAELINMLKNAGISVAPLSDYTYPKQNTATLVINYSGTDTSRLADYLAQIPVL